MLVLSRMPTECIHIGDRVVVTVVEIRGNKVRIGIEAPKDIHVLRGELQDRVSHPPVDDSDASVVSTESSIPGGIEGRETEGSASDVQRPAA